MVFEVINSSLRAFCYIVENNIFVLDAAMFNNFLEYILLYSDPSPSVVGRSFFFYFKSSYFILTL